MLVTVQHLAEGHVMPETSGSVSITQAQGAHLADYFESLAKIKEASVVALSDPSGKAVEMASQGAW